LNWPHVPKLFAALKQRQSRDFEGKTRQQEADMTEQHESALAGVLKRFDLAASDELRAAAQHIGRLIEQRERLAGALKACLAAHAKLNGHSGECESCKAGRVALAEVQRLKQKYRLTR